LDHPLHDQPARAAAEHNASIHAPGAGWDDGEFLIRRRAIKTCLDGRAIICRTITKPAEVKGRRPVYLFNLCRVPERVLRGTSLGIAKVFIIMIESSKGKMF
jgi:hypothetical protein